MLCFLWGGVLNLLNSWHIIFCWDLLHCVHSLYFYTLCQDYELFKGWLCLNVYYRYNLKIVNILIFTFYAWGALNTDWAHQVIIGINNNFSLAVPNYLSLKMNILSNIGQIHMHIDFIKCYILICLNLFSLSVLFVSFF